ncbi:hypothetical protein Dxin01_04051 [Deinococcus xinjiangensis]|uniref:IrrE N-terminal-like domain-containing protein n=1 Tax=Deinococcus xinjiangensis TaxID=457454 RepID=A0ABP9VGE6_9DEIO
MDDIIHDLFEWSKAQHQEAEWESDMPTLTRRLGFNYRRHEYSFYDPDSRTIFVRYDATSQEARVDTAHELMHAVSMEGSPSYDAVLRYYHASVSNLDDHIEVVTDHGADRFLMPDGLVEEIVKKCGYTARAIWELSRFANVNIYTALRRFVHFRPDRRVAAFFSSGGYILGADARNLWLPFWLGDRIPEPHLLLEHGISTFNIPNCERQMLGVVLVDDFEAA